MYVAGCVSPWVSLHLHFRSVVVTLGHPQVLFHVHCVSVCFTSLIKLTVKAACILCPSLNSTRLALLAVTVQPFTKTYAAGLNEIPMSSWWGGSVSLKIYYKYNNKSIFSVQTWDQPESLAAELKTYPTTSLDAVLSWCCWRCIRLLQSNVNDIKCLQATELNQEKSCTEHSLHLLYSLFKNSLSIHLHKTPPLSGKGCMFVWVIDRGHRTLFIWYGCKVGQAAWAIQRYQGESS